jgi:hypothetical protein
MAIQISGTTVIDNSRNVINVAAGSSTAPSIRSSDGNTGIYFPSADNLSFATNGVLRLNIDSAGDTVADGQFKERFAGQYWNVVTQADVGYGASQVPLNQYLGQLAFLDDFSPNGLRRNGGASDDVIVGTGGTVGIISDFYVNGRTYIPNVASDITMSNGNIIFPAVAGRGIYFGGETSGGSYGYIREIGDGQLDFGSDDAVRFFETDANTERVNWSLNTGTFTFNGTVIGGTRLLAGTSSVTGTASQNLQVSGGAYVSDDVGIGTTNPRAKLDVNGSFRSTGIGTFENGNTTYGTETALSLELGRNNNANAGALKLWGTNSNTYGLIQATTNNLHIDNVGGGIYLNFYDGDFVSFGTGAGAESARFTGSTGTLTLGSTTATGTASQRLQVTGGGYISGNVGIGTTNPQSILDILSSGSSVYVRNTSTTSTSALFAADSDYFINFRATFIEKKGTSAAGNIFSGIPNANLGVLAFQNTTNALIYTNGGTPLIFGTTSLERMRIDSSGNLGVGVINPSFKIDCSSDIRIQSTNKMRFGGTTGTTNFYIQYNSTSNSLDFVAG